MSHSCETLLQSLLITCKRGLVHTQHVPEHSVVSVITFWNKSVTQLWRTADLCHPAVSGNGDRAVSTQDLSAPRSQAATEHTFIIPCVLDKVLLEDAHEDGGQEARQQQHRHARVDDAEPVDLQSACICA